MSIKDMKLPRAACVRAQIILPLEVRRRPDAGAVPPGRCHVEHGTDGLLVLPAMPTVVLSSTAFPVPASFSGLTSTTRPIATTSLPTSHLPLEDGRNAIIICCRPHSHLHVELREVLTSRRGIHVGDKMNTDYRGGRSA